VTSNPLLAAEEALAVNTPEEEAGLARKEWFQTQGRGYSVLQATRPATAAYFLADSPVATLAWIYEKLHDWTDSYPFTDDEILTWISIYIFSTAGAWASVRIYYEICDYQEPSRSIKAKTREYNADVPLGVSNFPNEITPAPSRWAKQMGNVVFNEKHDKGGHFPAWEVPELLVGDLMVMFGKGGGAYGVVKERDGY
jgi:hypothetical protein